MSGKQQMTATPRRPAAYLRMAARAITAGAMCIQRQRLKVLSAAAALGWPEPTVYTDAGTPGWNRPGPHLASLAAAISARRRPWLHQAHRMLWPECKAASRSKLCDHCLGLTA